MNGEGFMKVIAKTASLLVFGACLLGSGMASAQTAAPGAAPAATAATAIIKDSKGQTLGKVMLTAYAGGVVIRGELDGMPPGWHAIHIHANGKCEPDFAAAGGHFNPANVKHGLGGKEPHAGDLPNFFVDDRGHARFEGMTHGVTMTDGAANNLFGPNGTSFIIHAKGDDYVTDPAGASGDRIACGVITKG